MKRQVKFHFEFLAKKKYLRKELTRFFLKANNFVFVQNQESLSRLVNRCLLTGSTRVIQKTKLSRQTFKKYINNGTMAGFKKSSW